MKKQNYLHKLAYLSLSFLVCFAFVAPSPSVAQAPSSYMSNCLKGCRANPHKCRVRHGTSTNRVNDKIFRAHCNRQWNNERTLM